jgi:hypothetical protein
MAASVVAVLITLSSTDRLSSFLLSLTLYLTIILICFVGFDIICERGKV